MITFKWNAEKNLALKSAPNKGVCFEDIVAAIEGGGLLDDVSRLNNVKYSHQRIFVVLLNDYVYAVPYVRDGSSVFLKTVFPSRKFKALYLKDLKNET